MLMKIKRLYSPKTAAKPQIIFAAVSAIFLAVATWMTTSHIPKIENKINNEDSMIKEIRHQITKDLVQGLYAMDVHTDRRIDLLDVRLESIMVSSKSKREQLLLEGARNKTLDEIKRWDLLFRSEEQHQYGTPLPFFDANTPIEEKIIKLDSALTRARRDAYSRLSEIIDRIHTHEIRKEQHQAIHSKKQTWFRRFQLIGLLALVIAVIIESHQKLRQVEAENQNSDKCEHVVEPNRGESPVSG